MDFFNKKRVAALEELNAALQTQLDAALAANTDLETRLKSFEHDDTKPWVEITSEGFDANKGIKIAMDWNDAFVSYLEDLSIKGPTAEAAVQRWLALVNLHLIEQLENEAIESDPRGTVQDVVDGY